ncbi:family 43 glycosylhydrolase [Paenibacillus sp. 1P07SE]|uniref:family 43 glycosylhydrolase n=1 Tax=Paenibacillus sp. 1P07SE TaxID=3132209 RepID=UPI0039A5724B
MSKLRVSKKSVLVGAVLVIAAAVLVVWMVMAQMNGSETADQPYAGHGGTFKNTLADMDTPDPSIAYKDGFYYMTFTHNGADIMVMKARTLDFKDAERKVVWYPPVGTAYSSALWAPEIQYLQGKWYIYFAADDGANENHRMYALEADADDPMGSYTFRGQITDETDRWAIDGLVLEHEESLYFVWSGWEGEVNIAQNTYIAPMSDPLTISGPRVLLSEPDLEWERAGGPPYINEGQAFLKKDGRVFMLYSGAGSWTPHYSIGMLALKPGGDPLEPMDWEKSEQPLMTMDEEAGVYGPGHNTIAPSPDGTEQWNVYHATSGIGDGWSNRRARAQRVLWDENGMPELGSPLPLDAAIPMPSGSGVFHAAHAEALEDGGLRYTHLPLGKGAATEAPLLLHYRNTTGSEVTVTAEPAGGAPVELVLSPLAGDETGYAYAVLEVGQGGQSLVLSELSGEGAEILAVEIPRYEAEYAQSLGLTAATNPFASGTGIVEGTEGGELVFPAVIVPASGTYTVRIAAGGREEDELSLSVETGGKEETVQLPPSQRNEFPVVEHTISLRQGVNSITLKPAKGSIAFDYIDIIRK